MRYYYYFYLIFEGSGGPLPLVLFRGEVSGDEMVPLVLFRGETSGEETVYVGW